MTFKMLALKGGEILYAVYNGDERAVHSGFSMMFNDHAYPVLRRVGLTTSMKGSYGDSGLTGYDEVWMLDIKSGDYELVSEVLCAIMRGESFECVKAKFPFVKIKGEEKKAVELTVAEIEERLGVSNLKIIKD